MLVGIRHAAQHRGKSWHHLLSIAPVARRKIGAPIIRTPIRCEEDGHSPTALTGQSLYRLHIDVVDIRSLLAVYLYRDKMLVHLSRDILVLERFALHDMAPVASRVSNTEQDRFILLLRFLQSFFTPRIPVYRIMRVLKQIWTRLINEPVGVLMLSLCVVRHIPSQ